jgi:hypothetical protein
MKQQYETLDDYLDDLDAIKEKIADKPQGMTTKEILEYFAGSERCGRAVDQAGLHCPRHRQSKGNSQIHFGRNCANSFPLRGL